MADRRPPDLSYGHMGEASYDIDDQKWVFQRTPSSTSIIQVVTPLLQCIPPAMQMPAEEVAPSLGSQMSWLAKELPETGAASGIISSLVRSSPARRSRKQSRPALLAAGSAINAASPSDRRGVNILAMASGEAGDALRLIHLRSELLCWGRPVNCRVSSHYTSVSGNAFWIDGRGPILQISFGTDTEGLSSWLVVRKLDASTILRPTFHQESMPPRVPSYLGLSYPSSRLDANPVVTFTREMTGGQPHVDVAFNPWWLRRLAFMDEGGNFSVWDLEGQRKCRAARGPFGHMSGDLLTAKPLAGSWGRVIWADFNTLMMFDRRNLAMFSVSRGFRDKPKRLKVPELIDPRSEEWILDVRRHQRKLNRIFILTTSRLILLQFSPAVIDTDKLDIKTSLRILMSCLHFRSPGDLTAKFDLIYDHEAEACTALVYSETGSFVTFLKIYDGNVTDQSIRWSAGGFSLPTNQQNLEIRAGTMCVIASKYVVDKTDSNPGKYESRNVKFYQLLIVDTNLGLWDCEIADIPPTAPAVNDDAPGIYSTVSPPDSRSLQPEYSSASRIRQYHFVVPDGVEDQSPDMEFVQESTEPKHDLDPPLPETLSHNSMLVNASRIYRTTFCDDLRAKGAAKPVELDVFLATYDEFVSRAFDDGGQFTEQGVSLFADLSRSMKIKGDIDDVAAGIESVADSLHLTSTESTSVALHSISQYLMSDVQSDTSSAGLPKLSKLYDKLIDLWVTPLPVTVSVPVRMHLDRMVRQVAIELYLSCIVINVRNKSIIPPAAEEVDEAPQFTLPIHVRGRPTTPSQSSRKGKARASSVGTMHSSPTLPPLNITNEDDIPADPPEDPAIARLRMFTPSIGTSRTLGPSRSSILSQWPSVPGSDPTLYVWQPPADDAETDFDTEFEEAASRKHEERLRRRTERFLKRESQKAQASSQATPARTVRTGSQPAMPKMGVPASSSQVAPAELPMTQPVGGIYGSRKLLGRKAKGVSQRRKGF